MIQPIFIHSVIQCLYSNKSSKITKLIRGQVDACVNQPRQKRVNQPRQRNFFPINAPGMGRFQLLILGVLGYGLELRFWVVIAIIVSLTLTITLITTLTII